MSEQKPATLAEGWTLFRQTRQFQETGQFLKDMAKETRQLLKDMTKETDRQLKETDRQIGRLGNRFGDLIEYLVAPNLLSKFETFGYQFTSISWNHQVKKKTACGA